MGKSSRRYFHHGHRDGESTSGVSSSSSRHGYHSSQAMPTASSSSHQHRSNKQASTELKKAIQSKPFVPLEDQVKILSKIEEIQNNQGSFKPKTFVSSRTTSTAGTKHPPAAPVVIDLADIPLPSDDSDWRENPRVLFATKLLEGDAKTRRKRWLENLMQMAKKLND